jgi:two-component system sensor histidine kinase QseC
MISIRRQLTRNLLAVFIVLLGGGLVALYFFAREELFEQFDDALRTRALAVASLTLEENGQVKIDFTDQIFHSFGKDRPRDFFELWRASRPPVARSESLNGTDLPRPDETSNRGRFQNLTLPNGRPGRAISLGFTPNQDSGETHGDNPKEPLLLVVATDRDEFDELLNELMGIGAVCGVLLLGAMVWVVPRVLRRGLRPLDQLGERAGRIDADSLATRFATGDLPAELQPIAGRLNELLARLETSFERERRFSADLAHELRTPLAELRSLAECALKWPESRDVATDHETLAIAVQMQAIVTHLLALVRGDQQQLASRNETVDLAALASEVWRPLVARASERQLNLTWSLEPARVMADPVLLRSILRNLFENTVDYAPIGGEVTIRLETGPAAAIFRIANATDNLEPADVAKLFDRFWRKEEARSGGRHFGLGLPLARMFAQAMGWTLTAALDERRRLEFTLTGPQSLSGE